MQPNYRAIFTEMLLVQSAAIEAFAGAAAHCVVLVGQQYQQALITFVRGMPPNGEFDASTHPGSGKGSLQSANLEHFGRAFAALPRISMMIFLSRYNDLRGKRNLVRD